MISLKIIYSRHHHFPETTLSAFWNKVCIILIKQHLQIRDPKPREGGRTSKGKWGNRGTAELKHKVSDTKEARDWWFNRCFRKWMHGSYFTKVFYKSPISIRLTQVHWNLQEQKHVIQKSTSGNFSS